MPYDKNDPDLIAKNEQLTKLMTLELYNYLLSLIPTPQRIIDVHNRHQASYAASLKGTLEDIKECEESRLESLKLQNLVHALGKALSSADPKVPQMLGMEQAGEKPPPVAVHLSQPQDFKVVFNPKGQLVGGVSRVQGAKAYEIWGCQGDPNIEANWRRLVESFNCKGIVIADYERDKALWLKIRATRAAGPGPWSNVITINFS